MTKPKPEIHYVYRGLVERVVPQREKPIGRYVWRRCYSETSPDGGVEYPWLTPAECRADAKARGARAVLLESHP